MVLNTFIVLFFESVPRDSMISTCQVSESKKRIWMRFQEVSALGRRLSATAKSKSSQVTEAEREREREREREGEREEEGESEGERQREIVAYTCVHKCIRFMGGLDIKKFDCFELVGPCRDQIEMFQRWLDGSCCFGSETAPLLGWA